MRDGAMQHATSAADQLTADPRIEGLELRRELARTRTRWRLAAAVVAVSGLGVCQWLVASWFAIPVAVAVAWLGVSWDRWQGAVADDERIEHDLRALTSVYHESPRTIRKWLSTQFIDDSIRNLLAAALDSEEFAHGYWDQAVKPFLSESQRGFKANWRYHIDLADLEADVELERAGQPAGRISRAEHRRLHTSVDYAHRIPRPGEMYYVAAVFESEDLPSWFKRQNFLLREVVVLPPDVTGDLPERDPSMEHLPETFGDGPTTAAIHEPIADLAGRLMRAHVVIGETALQPVALHIDRSGISWGFALDEELRSRLRAGSEIRVEMDTFISRSQRSFPVVIAAPTRNPTVHFSYALTDIERVEVQTFFSAQRPWDARLTTRHLDLKRVDVLTEPTDWVFAGSGCLFAWWEPDRAGPEHARAVA